MNSNRRASSSGATSVWVGSRPKEPVFPPTKVSNHTLHSHTPEQSKSTGRSSGTGDGEYVVVSFTDSTSNSIPNGRKNSTGNPPFSNIRKNSTDISYFSNNRKNSADLPSVSNNRKNSTGIPPSLSSRKNSADFPSLSSSRKNSAVIPSLPNALSAGQTFSNACHIINGSSEPFPLVSPLETVPVQPTSCLPNTWAGNTNPLLANGLGNTGSFMPNIGTGLGLSGSNNILGNASSLLGGNNAASILANTGLGVYSNLLANSLNSNVMGNITCLYGGGNFIPAAATSMPMLPPVSPSISSLLFQHQYGLTPEALAASLDETLSLTQATSLMLPQTLPQTGSLLDLPQPLFSSLPSVHPSVDSLPASLATNQTLLSPDLQFPMLPTLLPPATLPLNTASTILPTQTSVAPVRHNATYTKSPPPLLNPNPSKAFHARRSSLKVREPPNDRKTPMTRPTLQKSRSMDQADHYHTTSGLGSSVSSRSTSSSPLPRMHEVQVWDQEVHSPGLTTEPCYDLPLDPQCCMRCGKKVYSMEKQVGPVRRVLYHQACFTCSVCRTALALHSYYLNDADKDDLNVYCASHKPVVRHNPLDSDALVFQQAVLLFGNPDRNTACDDEE